MLISINKILSKKMIVNLFFLYFGKVSGIVVNFFFLPLYSSILGVEQFGLVATILSLQALLMMLDMGLATIAIHKISSNQNSNIQITNYLRDAENALFLFYIIILSTSLLLNATKILNNISWHEIVIAIFLLYFIVIQNVFYSALISKNEIIKATFTQVFWSILRAIATAITLIEIQANFIMFLYAQLAISIIHFLHVRKIIFKILNAQWFESSWIWDQKIKNTLNLILKGRSLLLSGIAGAAAMQLDKQIISLYMSPASLTPYFLATTISAAPLSILATPIVQYFQPKIISDYTSKNKVGLKRNLKLLILSIVLFSVLPALILIQYNYEVINFWLNNSPMVATVSIYSKILLIGYTISALGYIPYVLLIAQSDFNFQAKVSAVSTLLLLCSVFFCAYLNNIQYICYAFVIYFSIGTLVFTYKTKNIFSKMECQ